MNHGTDVPAASGSSSAAWCPGSGCAPRSPLPGCCSRAALGPSAPAFLPQAGARWQGEELVAEQDLQPQSHQHGPAPWSAPGLRGKRLGAAGACSWESQASWGRLLGLHWEETVGLSPRDREQDGGLGSSSC